jgi:dihydroflavonol-4-reductase
MDELIKPAVDGTMGALRACHKHRVKRVVITSSRAAISFGHNPPKEVYSDSDWSDIDFLTEKGVEFLGGYTLSKTLAEKAAWDF